MYARSTTVRGDPQAMDDLVRYARDEVMPALKGMSGCVGMSMLADRESGRAVITSAWADETSMNATEQGVREFRERAAQIARGEQSMQAWEIGLVHRVHGAHDGACTRVLWGEFDPARVDDGLSTFRMTMLPRLEELPGFCSVSMMVDRATGRCAQAVTYDSRDDMRRAGEIMQARREEFSREIGVRLGEIAEFDLVVHELRVPEMA
jgi:heme-degrading monooxygenase HmoA